MIGKAMQDAMNEQINRELFSSYLYLSMAAYFENKNLAGFAHWMRIQEAGRARARHEVLRFRSRAWGAGNFEIHRRAWDDMELKP